MSSALDPRAASPSTGESRLIRAFGDVAVSLRSADHDWLRHARKRYGGDAAEAAAPSFEIEHERAGTAPAGLGSPLAIHLESAKVDPTSDGFVLVTSTTRAEVDLVRGRARLRSPSAMYGLDNVLRRLLPYLYADGLVLHGAALADGPRGFAACGPSGAGKSTLASLVGPDALSDELLALRLGARAPRIVSLPFWHARPGTARLAHVLLLVHGERHRLERMSPGEALRRLSRQVLWPQETPSALERCFVNLVGLTERVPVSELAFVPEPGVWRFLREETSSS